MANHAQSEIADYNLPISSGGIVGYVYRDFHYQYLGLPSEDQRKSGCSSILSVDVIGNANNTLQQRSRMFLAPYVRQATPQSMLGI